MLAEVFELQVLRKGNTENITISNHIAVFLKVTWKRRILWRCQYSTQKDITLTTDTSRKPPGDAVIQSDNSANLVQ